MDTPSPDILYDLQKFVITTKAISLSAQNSYQSSIVVPINDNILSVESWVETKWDTILDHIDDFFSGRGYYWADRMIDVKVWLQINFKHNNRPVKIVALWDCIPRGEVRKDYEKYLAVEGRLETERNRIQSLISQLL